MALYTREQCSSTDLHLRWHSATVNSIELKLWPAAVLTMNNGDAAIRFLHTMESFNDEQHNIVALHIGCFDDGYCCCTPENDAALRVSSYDGTLQP
ncbi:hypothetical protein EVAR_52131_1 [Eumeta japonica]|uniref:Uncharacterized protein n=1 Tax=Eumeta variegata TaxID=151549 RepID=A0A4C1XT46_EUMVA|nr:hypothetical protein EVAR_52131_1 [Eumeta japonica]